MGKTKARAKKPPKQDRAEVRIGYDGNPPVFRPARDIVGQGKREVIDGPQNINIDRLEWYLDHRLIERHHHTAGRKLQLYAETAELSSGVSLLAGARGGGSMTSLSDAKCDALDKLNKARAELSPMNWRLIDLVVLQNITAQKASRQMGFHERSAMPTLVMALDSLAKHYGLCTAPRK